MAFWENSFLNATMIIIPSKATACQGLIKKNKELLYQ